MICRMCLPGTHQLCLAPKALGGALGLIALAVALALLPLTWALAGVAAAILAVTVVISPALGLIVLALAIPFGRALLLSSSSIGLVDVLVFLILAAWLARGLTARHLTLERIPLLWPLAIFLWLGIASLASAVSWRQGVLEWLKWAEFAVLYLVAAQVLRRRQVVWVLIAFFGVAVYEVALGALQFTRNAGPEAFEVSGQFTRAYGTLQQPNPYAGYLGYLMPVALSLAIGALASWWTSRKTTSLLLGLLTLVVALILLAGIGVSWSRGAWLGAATAILVVIAFRSRRAVLILGSIGLALCIIGLLLGPARLPATISERITDLSGYVIGPDPAATEITDQNFSVLERLAHWQAGIRMFNGAPWLGIGIGNYGVVYPGFALPHWYDPLGHAHNLYINFLAETGILGTVAFLAFWASVATLAYRTAQNPDPFVRSLALGLLGTVAYLTLHNLFDNLFVQHLQLQLALLLGAVVALRAEAAPASL
jgi:putative inorganic carbon (HCO3(-)) transporter